MVKPAERVHSHIAVEAIAEVGRLIRLGRKDYRMTAQELAERAGISRALLYRIEHGDPACSIGAVFEAATIVGVPLFESPMDARSIEVRIAPGSASRVGVKKMRRVVRRKTMTVKDDF